jgi:hypothetical protein
MTERLEVLLEAECPPAEMAAVAEVFEAAGIQADVSAAYARRSAVLLAWIIIIGGAGLTWSFIKAAVQGAGDEAGREGWRALMRLVKDLHEARRGSRAPEGDVSIETSEVREILLRLDLPEEAFRQLWAIEEPHAPMSGQLRWDRERQAWVDPLAGTIPCGYPGCQDGATQGRTRQLGEAHIVGRSFCDVHAAAADTGDPQAWA